MTGKTEKSRAEAERKAWLAGDSAAAALREALDRVGVRFADLRGSMPVGHSGFVLLGYCSAAAAVRLAKVVSAAHPGPRVDEWQDGKSAAAGLTATLQHAGLTLPTVQAAPPPRTADIVSLGGCSAGAAVKLAEIVNAAADATPNLRVTAR